MDSHRCPFAQENPEPWPLTTASQAIQPSSHANNIMSHHGHSHQFAIRNPKSPIRTWFFIRLGRWRWHRQGCPGDSHQWVWPHDQPFDRAACRRLLDQHFLPAFTRVAQAAPQPYGVAHLLALADIVSPEEHPLAQITFDFAQADLPQAASRIEAFFLEQTPLTLKPGSMIRFVLLNPAELLIPGWPAARVARRLVLDS